MNEPPTLAEQIEAVERAAKFVMGWIVLTADERVEMVIALGAAAEQLKTWEFARETLS